MANLTHRPRPRRTYLLWIVAIIFCIIGIAVAYQQGFEKRVGREIQKAAPVARRVIPAPAKSVLRQVRELLPIYGTTGQWLARKGASIVYFGVVSVLVWAARRRKPATLAGTLLITIIAGILMSGVIELLELPEEIGDQIFDLTCGATGGLCGGLLAWSWWRRHATIGGA